MTTETDKLTQEAWELLGPDLASAELLEDRLRAGRLRILSYRSCIIELERDIEIGEAVLAKLRDGN